MRNRFILLFCSAFLLISLPQCKKDAPQGCMGVSPADEKAAMATFRVANGITYSEHVSGILYEIVLPGSGITPANSNVVSCVYTGKLLSGNTFEATAIPIDFVLGNLIEGWRIGIALIKKGGRIKMVIPSSLAYGCTGSGGAIPANSPLFFDITLSDVK